MKHSFIHFVSNVSKVKLTRLLEIDEKVDPETRPKKKNSRAFIFLTFDWDGDFGIHSSLEKCKKKQKFYVSFCVFIRSSSSEGLKIPMKQPQQQQQQQQQQK